MTDGGGKFTDENRANPLSLISVLNTGRAVVLTQRHAKSNTIHPGFKQQYYPKYEPLLQEDECVSVFRLPRVVEFNDMMDGLLFMGSVTGKGEFKRVRSRNEYHNMLGHRIGRYMLNKHTYYLPDSSSELVTVFKEGVKNVFLEIVADDPTSVEGFNIEKDDYPITMDALKKVEEMVRQGTIFSYLKYPSNKASNSQDDSQLKPTEV
jgi:hypothetical protein